MADEAEQTITEGKEKERELFSNSFGEALDQALKGKELAEAAALKTDEPKPEDKAPVETKPPVDADKPVEGEQPPPKVELEDLSVPDDLPEVKPVADKQEEDHSATPEDDDAKRELTEVRSDPHLPEKTRKSIERLLGQIQTLKKSVREAQENVEKVRKETPAPVAPDPINDADRKELTMLRRRYSLDHDETIKKNFDEKIQSNEAALLDIVRKNIAPEDAKKIEQMGFERFAKIPKAFSQFLEVLDENDPAAANLVRHKYAEQTSLRHDKEQTVKKLVGEADQWIKEIEENYQKNQASVQENEKAIEKIKEDFFSQVTTSDPLLMTIDTSKLQGEEKARAEAENTKRKVYHDEVKMILQANDIEGYRKVYHRAAIARPLLDSLKNARAKIKTLEERLAKIEQARSAHPGQAAAPTAKPKEEKPLPFGEALDALARGRR